MNIQNWGMGRIMQLPDFLFGQKYLVSVEILGDSTNFAFDISEIALPEKFVLWQFIIDPYRVTSAIGYIRIAYADVLATTEAEFMTFEPALPGWGLQGPEPREIHLSLQTGTTIINLRKFVTPGGKRLTACGVSIADNQALVRVGIVVSGVPKEVPDWLSSGTVINHS